MSVKIIIIIMLFFNCCRPYDNGFIHMHFATRYAKIGVYLQGRIQDFGKGGLIAVLTNEGGNQLGSGASS